MIKQLLLGRGDPQKMQAYLWENKHVKPLPGASTQMELDHIRALVRNIIPDISLQEVRPRRGGSAVGGANCIQLPEWARRPWVIIHEMGHMVVRRREQEDQLPPSSGHGGRWMGCYLGLLRDHLGADADALVYSARAAGLEVGDFVFPAPTGKGNLIQSIAQGESVEDLEVAVRKLRRKLATMSYSASIDEVEATRHELHNLEQKVVRLRGLSR